MKTELQGLLLPSSPMLWRADNCSMARRLWLVEVSDQSTEMSGSLWTPVTLEHMVAWSGRKGWFGGFLSCSHPHFLRDLAQGLQCHAVPFKSKLAMGIFSACENWKCRYGFDHKPALHVRQPSHSSQIESSSENFFFHRKVCCASRYGALLLFSTEFCQGDYLATRQSGYMVTMFKLVWNRVCGDDEVQVTHSVSLTTEAHHS